MTRVPRSVVHDGKRDGPPEKHFGSECKRRGVYEPKTAGRPALNRPPSDSPIKFTLNLARYFSGILDRDRPRAPGFTRMALLNLLWFFFFLLCNKETYRFNANITYDNIQSVRSEFFPPFSRTFGALPSFCVRRFRERKKSRNNIRVACAVRKFVLFIFFVFVLFIFYPPSVRTIAHFVTQIYTPTAARGLES